MNLQWIIHGLLIVQKAGYDARVCQKSSACAISLATRGKGGGRLIWE